MIEIFGHDATVKAAPEPTNIIWENQEVSHASQYRAELVVGFLVSLFIFCTFVLFAALKSRSGKNKIKYPSKIDCDYINSQFENDVTSYERYAQYDHAPTKLYRGAGIYQCFCKTHSSKADFFSQGHLCQLYQQDQLWGLSLANFVTFLVSVINVVIRTLNIVLIEKIGLHTQSKKVGAIMTSIFVASFINSGIILLLTNANLEYSVIKWIPIKNQYTDFDENWYMDISKTLLQTMTVMAFFPYAEFCGFFTIKTLLKIADGGLEIFSQDDTIIPKTKKKTQQQYINLYAGPEYSMHFKYSSIMVQVYVSFMYGMFIPMLFFTTLIGITNMYVVERLCLAYYYRQPPAYDAELNLKAISLLKSAPILMFTFGYWALSNR